MRLLGRINAAGFCLTASARILVRDVGYISIKDVKQGNYVQTSPTTYHKVTAVYEQPMKSCLKLKLMGGYEIEGSYDHPVMTKYGWKEIGLLTTDDYVKVIGENNEYIYTRVLSSESIGKQKVYDLTVDDTGSFISNFILVHNTKGQRTIAGSLIFTVFDKHLVRRIINEGLEGAPYDSIPREDKEDMLWNMKMDELPPLDVTITLNNEFGNRSVIRIYGITFIDEGQVMSIEDMITEQTMSYMAVDIDVISEVVRGGRW